jgi:hypothetical protein
MHGKKKKLKAHHRHTRHLVIPTSPPRSLEKSSEERASFGPALGSQHLSKSMIFGETKHQISKQELVLLEILPVMVIL